jgi:hypothetical protein
MTLNSTFCDKIDFKYFSQKGCSDRCLRPCEQTFYTTIQSKTMKEYKYLIYINKIYDIYLLHDINWRSTWIME